MGEDLTPEQFWADIIAAHKLDTPPQGALCVIDFARQVGMSEKHSRDILNDYVERGVMECRKFAKPNGKSATYYWRKQ